LFVLVLLIIFSFRSGSPPGAEPGAKSPCLVRAAYRNSMCQHANNSPLRTHEDWGKTNVIAPFNTGPVPLPDGTKQHGEPTKLPTDPRSREDTANGVGCLIQNGQTAASVSGSGPSPSQLGKNSQLMPASDPVQEKTNLHGHMKRTTFAAKNSPCRYLYIQSHSIEEISNSTERHFVVTCLLFCICWMDIAV
jgi:hypothetical protein